MLKTAIALLLAASAVPAPAQQSRPAASESPEILVEGSRDLDKRISDFVKDLTPAPLGGQIGRFDWAVCPAAIGLGDARNARIVARLRQVAKAAGIKAAPGGCRPNVMVIVTGDTRKMVDQLATHHPAYFREVPSGELERLRREAGPVAAWKVEGRLDPDGVAVTRDTMSGTDIVTRTGMASKMSLPTRPHFIASIVVMDVDALAGLTVTQVADYAAMRAFARTDPTRLKDSPAPTILTIIDAPMNSEVPITMTEWDLAFLKALYASSDHRPAKRQRGEMRRLVREDLTKQEIEEEN